MHVAESMMSMQFSIKDFTTLETSHGHEISCTGRGKTVLHEMQRKKNLQYIVVR